ncbi:hypothetical protein C8R44DRAFT_869871 [Mycena epipterygia]|nr:hypothetical protein C8R44DRAFT_869871 [Mycena epipterygia]
MSHLLAKEPVSNNEVVPQMSVTEKRKATRAANLAREEAENIALAAAMQGTARKSKTTALTNKLAVLPAKTRSSLGPQKRSTQSVTVEPVVSDYNEAQESVQLQTCKQSTQRKPARKHAPPVIQDLDSDSALQPVVKSATSKAAKATMPTILAGKKPQKKQNSDDDESSSPSPESGNDEGDVSEVDNDHLEKDPAEFEQQHRAERPRVISHRAPSVDDDDVNMMGVDADVTNCGRRRRRGSSSSRGDSEDNVPLQTDFESDNKIDRAPAVDWEDEEYHDQPPPPRKSVQSELDNSGSDEDGVEPPPRARKSAQQAKYDLEKPTVQLRPPPVKKAGRKIKAEQHEATADSDIEALLESFWGLSARLVHPRRGELKLTDQHALLQLVIKDAMELTCVDVIFVNLYPLAAAEIKFRVHKDLSFSQSLADLIYARIGILQNTIKRVAVAKVPIFYQLTSDGVMPAVVRERVTLALKNQQYIFPIIWYDPKSPVGGATGEPAPKKGTVQELKFRINLPFYASPIVDIMQETFFNTSKSLGRKHPGLYASSDEDLPKEVELPASMPAFVAANIHIQFL